MIILFSRCSARMTFCDSSIAEITFSYFRIITETPYAMGIKELINVAFLNSLGNHVQSADSSCSIARYVTRSIARYVARSIARFIALSKIYGLYRAPGLGARISEVKCRKSYDNIPSRDNLDTRAAIYIVWRCLALGLRH